MLDEAIVIKGPREESTEIKEQPKGTHVNNKQHQRHWRNNLDERRTNSCTVVGEKHEEH